MAKLGDQNSETPEPIVTELGVVDYVGDVTPHAKIQSDHPSEGVPANELYTLACLKKVFL